MLWPELLAGDGGEVGKLAEGEVDLEYDALASHRGQSAAEALFKVVGLKEAKQAALGVGVGEDYSGVQHLAVQQLHPRRLLITNDDPGHLGFRADLGAMATGATGQGRSYPAHASGHGTNRDAKLGPVVEHHVDAARGIWPGRQTYQAIRADAGLRFFGLEAGVQEVLHGTHQHFLEEVGVLGIREPPGDLLDAERGASTLGA